MRHGDAAIRAKGAGYDDLAGLVDVGPLVSSIQQRQEFRDAEVHDADVDAEYLVEGRRVNVPELLLVLEQGVRGGGLRDGAREACVGDEEVDATRLLFDVL